MAKLKRYETVRGKPWFEPSNYVWISKCKMPCMDLIKREIDAVREARRVMGDR